MRSLSRSIWGVVLGVGLVIGGSAMAGDPVPPAPAAPAKPSCDESCRACNMSQKDRVAAYGVKETPARFLYAMPFLEAVPLDAYVACQRKFIAAGGKGANPACTELVISECTRACTAAK